MSKTVEQRRALLDKAIEPYIREGWIIQSQTATRAQLIQKRERGCLGKLFFGLWDLVFKRKGYVLNIEVDAQGHVRRYRTKAYL